MNRLLSRLLGSTLAKAIAIACVVLLAYLSLIPSYMSARTPLPGVVEHAIAYAGTGIWLVLAYRRARLATIIAGLVLYAGALETGQIWAVGRTPQIWDWLASSAGAATGVVAVHLLVRHLTSAAGLNSLVLSRRRSGQQQRAA